MKWLKDIDSSFDSLLTDCYRQREMELERHINKIRCVGLIALFLFETFISIYTRGFDWSFISIDLATLSITLIICFIIHRLANQNNYKAWLKYVSILLDYLIILVITIEIEYLADLKHFMLNFNQTEFELMMISVLIHF